MADLAFRMGATLRRLRTGKFNLEDAAGEADFYTSKLQRMETRDERINQNLTDLDKMAGVLGLSLSELIEEARVSR